MAKLELSLTEALKKKKVLKERIDKMVNEKELRSYTLVDYKKGNVAKTAINLLTAEEFETRAKSYIQSVFSLIDNYTELSKAINKANNTTEVTIGGKTMTISEAIALKSSSIGRLKESLAKKMIEDYNSAVRKINEVNRVVTDTASIDNYLASVLKEDDKKDSSLVESYVDTYRTLNMAVLVDPFEKDGGSVMGFVESIGKDLEDFAAEVDFKLSEVNARTIIEVEFAD